MLLVLQTNGHRSAGCFTHLPVPLMVLPHFHVFASSRRPITRWYKLGTSGVSCPDPSWSTIFPPSQPSCVLSQGGQGQRPRSVTLQGMHSRRCIPNSLSTEAADCLIRSAEDGYRWLQQPTLVHSLLHLYVFTVPRNGRKLGRTLKLTKLKIAPVFSQL